MTVKKKSTLGMDLVKLLALIPNLFNTAQNIVKIVGIEARLAGKSLNTLLIFSLIAVGLFTCGWICILAFIFMGFYSLNLGWALSLLIVFLINLSLLIMIGFLLVKAKNELSFPITREIFFDP